MHTNIYIYIYINIGLPVLWIIAVHSKVVLLEIYAMNTLCCISGFCCEVAELCACNCSVCNKSWECHCNSL